MNVDKSSALLSIYDAAVSPEHWPKALDAFARIADSVGALLIAVDQVGLPFRIEKASSVYRADDVRYYLEHLGHYDEAVLSRTFAEVQPMRLLRDCDVWGDISLLEDRPDYRYMRDVFRARRKAGVRLSQGKGWMDIVTIQSGQEWQPTVDDLQQRLDPFLPHLAKVVEINRTFSLLRHRYHAALAALDYVKVGMSVVLPTGAIVVANREAQRIHDLDDGLRMVRGGTWRCLTGDGTAVLANDIRSVSSTAAGQGTQHETLMFAERKSGKRPFMIEVAPLRDAEGELERGLHGAILFIIDPENHRAISTNRLAQLFRLTEAEADVCSQMISGLSALEIAEARSVSEGTVRTQFKAIYAKTGVHRRADLLRLALTVDPPIELPEPGPG